MADEDVPEEMNDFIELNAELSKDWPVINEMKPAPEDADEWKDKTGKLAQLERWPRPVKFLFSTSANNDRRKNNIIFIELVF